MRVWVLILLLANLVLAGFVYLTETRALLPTPNNDLNADKLRLLPFSPDVPPPSTAPSVPVSKPVPAACLEWGGIAANDLQRARALLASLVLPPDRVSERNVEEPARFLVFIPPAGNAAATVARLKDAGLKDVSLQADNTISLGIFSSEESARRMLTRAQSKGFNQVRIEPRNPQSKEVAITVRDGRSDIAARLDQFREQIGGSHVRPIACPSS